MTIMNTIMANQLFQFKKEVDALLDSGMKKELAIVEVLKGYIKATRAILFEGNGYSDEWVTEAESRGLSNLKTTPEALAVYTRPEVADLFERHNIYSATELHARYEIELEAYIKKVQIESRVIGDLAINHIVSTALKYQSTLVENVKGQKEIGIEERYYAPTVETIKRIAEYTSRIQILIEEMTEARKEANNTEDTTERAMLYGTKVKGYFEEIRYCVDKLELIVDDDEWPLAKYRELLLIR
jgi:glutamine synthetase